MSLPKSARHLQWHLALLLDSSNFWLKIQPWYKLQLKTSPQPDSSHNQVPELLVKPNTNLTTFLKPDFQTQSFRCRHWSESSEYLNVPLNYTSSPQLSPPYFLFILHAFLNVQFSSAHLLFNNFPRLLSIHSCPLAFNVIFSRTQT